MKITYEPMTKGRHFFMCLSCGHQEVTYVNAVRITHYCNSKTIFEAAES